MKVIRQQHPAVDTEGITCSRVNDGRAEKAADIRASQYRFSLVGDQREEVQRARVLGATVIGHAWPPAWNGEARLGQLTADKPAVRTAHPTIERGVSG
ncbi:hypothetical protein D3C78_1596530 [compost metagenome]